MKLLFIWHAAVVEVYRKRIAELVKKQDLELLLLAPRKWAEGGSRVIFEAGEGPNDYQIIEGATFLNFHPSLHVYLTGLWQAINKFKPDIIHIVEEPFSLVTFQVVLFNRFCQVNAKIIIESWQNIYKKYAFPFNLIEQFNLKNADALIAGSTEIKEVLWRKNYLKTLKIIPLGLDLTSYSDNCNRQLLTETMGNSFVIGFVGRVEWYKGIFILLEAVFALPQDLNWKLLIIGAGSALAEAKALVNSRGLQNKVNFTGSIPHKKTVAYFKLMQVLVLPSLTTANWKEQFGRVLIEAMACGCPVIGSSSGEIPQVIDQVGLIFREGDITDLREKIIYLAHNKEKARKLSQRGLQRVKDLYSWPIIAEKTCHLYNELIAKK